jgi:hypothetical protein
MSERNSRAMRKRWRNPVYSDRMSADMKTRFVPKITVGTTPEPDLPASLNGLCDSLSYEHLEVLDCSPIRVNRQIVWRVVVLDGTDDRLKERYCPILREHRLHLDKFYSRPMADLELGGVKVVLFVRPLPTKGEDV